MPLQYEEIIAQIISPIYKPPVRHLSSAPGKRQSIAGSSEQCQTDNEVGLEIGLHHRYFGHPAMRLHAHCRVPALTRNESLF